MNGVYHLLQNERVNTLLVDGTISTGRTVKARNFAERLEVLFQEACIIYFLFFAQSPIQRKIQGAVDRLFGVHTALPFEGLKHLADVYGNDPDGLKAAWQSAKSSLGRFEKQAFESAIVPQARAYAAAGKQGHLLLDLAKACGYIPMRKTANGRMTVDITRKIDTEAIYKLGERLDALVGSIDPSGKPLGRVLKRSVSGKFGAFVLAAGVCSLFLGLVIPWLKQQITVRVTGQDQFPGAMNDGERQALLSTRYA